MSTPEHTGCVAWRAESRWLRGKERGAVVVKLRGKVDLNLDTCRVGVMRKAETVGMSWVAPVR